MEVFTRVNICPSADVVSANLRKAIVAESSAPLARASFICIFMPNGGFATITSYLLSVQVSILPQIKFVLANLSANARRNIARSHISRFISTPVNFEYPSKAVANDIKPEKGLKIVFPSTLRNILANSENSFGCEYISTSRSNRRALSMISQNWFDAIFPETTSFINSSVDFVVPIS